MAEGSGEGRGYCLAQGIELSKEAFRPQFVAIQLDLGKFLDELAGIHKPIAPLTNSCGRRRLRQTSVSGQMAESCPWQRLEGQRRPHNPFVLSEKGAVLGRAVSPLGAFDTAVQAGLAFGEIQGIAGLKLFISTSTLASAVPSVYLHVTLVPFTVICLFCSAQAHSTRKTHSSLEFCHHSCVGNQTLGLRHDRQAPYH